MTEKYNKAATVIWLALSAFMLIFGAYGIVKNILFMSRCSDKTEAVFIGYNIEKNHDSDGVVSFDYYPVYEYTYKNKSYQSVSHYKDYFFQKEKSRR